MYVVSYSGEHSHPRPTHRSSLAGSTRSKISPAAKPTPTSMTSSIASRSSSSPASASSFSPTTPIAEGDSAAEENADEGAEDTVNINEIGIFSGEEEEEGWDDHDDDGDDVLIPNLLWLMI